MKMKCKKKPSKVNTKIKPAKSKSKKVLEPIELAIQKLGLKPFSFEVCESGKCFYCHRALPNCGCSILELNAELEKLSDDFEELRVGYEVYTHAVFNLKKWPIECANVLAFDHQSNRLIYKRFSNGYFYNRTGTRKNELLSCGRWNENIEIIGVELDVIYNGLAVTEEMKNALRRDVIISKASHLDRRLTKRRAYEIVSDVT